MSNVMDTLRARGFVKQTVYEEELYKMLDTESVGFYIGFDPTADSLHVGHFIALMAMKHMQDAGHRPFILVGGGTAMIGDPSGRTDMRSMMTKETIVHNCECFKKQMSKFLTFEGPNAAVMVNNADWLWGLNYIDFIRDIGAYFSVNNMLRAECYKQRMDKGLSFLEFNYMLMQAYDFLYLNQKYGVKVQMGGDDQWSNILAGADLIRRKERQDAFAMTFTLLTTSDGKKMGKTQKGALWLDRNKTSPHDFYQYWRNVADEDVEKCLKLLTFLPVEYIEEICKFKDERIIEAKKVLAYEVTKLIHSEEDANECQKKAAAAFSGNADDMPEKSLENGKNMGILDALVALKIATSKGDARRLIESGAVKVNEDKISDISYKLPETDFVVIHKGKKVHFKVYLA
ncbi:MAG: tyrosine--tRNA ligase [Clostridia bacterium]|nr:tyrosine--tRNA ligase [Clostridia bacterium]